MEIMTEAHTLIPGDLCDTDGDIARVLRCGGATAIPAHAEVVCVEFPDKDRVRIVFPGLRTVTMLSILGTRCLVPRCAGTDLH
jgi:hypothetical protein